MIKKNTDSQLNKLKKKLLFIKIKFFNITFDMLWHVLTFYTKKYIKRKQWSILIQFTLSFLERLFTFKNPFYQVKLPSVVERTYAEELYLSLRQWKSNDHIYQWNSRLQVISWVLNFNEVAISKIISYDQS